jgi:hypothetical protein
VSDDELVVRARQVSLVARGAALRMDERRVALARSALVWWQGGAAEAYQRRVQERVNELAALSARLEGVARLSDDLAGEMEAAFAAARARALAGDGGGAVP